MRRGLAKAGIMTHLAGFVSYGTSGASTRGPGSTGVLVCEMRTDERTKTGTSKRSESS